MFWSASSWTCPNRAPVSCGWPCVLWACIWPISLHLPASASRASRRPSRRVSKCRARSAPWGPACPGSPSDQPVIAFLAVWRARGAGRWPPRRSVCPCRRGSPSGALRACLWPMRGGLVALRDRAGLSAGETLLVLGAGGQAGLAAIELGKLLGAQVIAAAGQTRPSGGCCRARGRPHHRFGRDRDRRGRSRADGRARRRCRVRSGWRRWLSGRAPRFGSPARG